ncbi:MAG: general secretion pathway protein GspD [Burkholderiales bacterium]|nr:general secretion pathway protein GspD [Burkholderiales bacterium]
MEGATRWVVMAVAVLLAGCAQQQIRDEANLRLREGSYEAAVSTLEQGVAQYPDSTALRSQLISARAEASTRLITQAAQERAQGNAAQATAVLERASRMEPGNERVMALQLALAEDRRVQARLEAARAQVAAGQKEQALRTLDAALREAPRQPELVALQRQIESDLRLGAPAARLALAETRPITLDFRNAPLSTVLDAITRGSGVNFILDRDVRQDARVTVFIRQARVEDAIDLVTSAHQLARRTVDAQTVLLYPNTPEKQREHQEQVIRVFHLAHAEAKATANLLRSMLRIKEPFVDERANLIALRESPDIIALAERLVGLHDVGEAEVLLDVEILEVKTTRLTELGINFPNSVLFTPLPAGGATGLTVDSLRSINSGRVGVSVAGLLVNLRREVGDSNTLANPRIRTKSREKARILIGDKLPVITATSSSTGFVAESVNYLDVGLKLDVEPLVSPDDDVTIKLGLEVSTLGTAVQSAGGSIAYQIGTRNANTVLRLRDGETQLLAGLISNDDRSSANRIPGLGDLPIAGRLFASQKDDVQRTELVLAITPHILRPAPRPDLSMAEMWVGSEQATRLRAPPGRGAVSEPAVAAAQAVSAVASAAAPTARAGAATAVPAAEAPSAQPMQLAWTSPARVNAGDEFVVSLDLAAATALRGVPLEVAFPSQMLDVLEVTEGDFFRQSGGATSFTHAVNPATGRISVGVLRSDATGATGRGSLVKLKLRAKNPGPIELGIANLRPIGVGGNPASGERPVLRLDVQ